MQPTNSEKQAWVEPKLIVFGDVETLTLAGNKNFGTGDGVLFQGQSTRLSG